MGNPNGANPANDGYRTPNGANNNGRQPATNPNGANPAYDGFRTPNGANNNGQQQTTNVNVGNPANFGDRTSSGVNANEPNTGAAGSSASPFNRASVQGPLQG